MKLIPLEQVLSILKFCEDRDVQYGTIRMYIEGEETIDPIATIDAMIEELAMSQDKELNSSIGKVAIESHILVLQKLKSRLSLTQPYEEK